MTEPQPAALTTTWSTPGGLEGVDGRPGERLGLGLAAGVQAEGAAAALAGRGHDLVAVGGQDLGGGPR